MKIHTDFITESDEEEIGSHVDAVLDVVRQMAGDGRLRILRFGWDYKNPNKWLGEIPDWIPTSYEWDSIAINEYSNGRRIAPHIDSPAFGDVTILSLFSDATMRFVSPAGETRDFVLPRRSLAVMSGELRKSWTHETLPLVGERRISIVYRKKII